MTMTDDEMVSEGQDLWALIEKIEAKASRKLAKYSDPSVFTSIKIRLRRFSKLAPVERKYIRERLTGRRISAGFIIRINDEEGSIHLVAG